MEAVWTGDDGHSDAGATEAQGVRASCLMMIGGQGIRDEAQGASLLRDSSPVNQTALGPAQSSSPTC